MLTKIEKHPLKDCYMLYSPSFGFIPPYFGSEKECKKLQVVWESKLSKL